MAANQRLHDPYDPYYYDPLKLNHFTPFPDIWKETQRQQDIIRQNFQRSLRNGFPAEPKNSFPAAEPYNSRVVDPAEYNYFHLLNPVLNRTTESIGIGSELNNSRMLDPTRFQFLVDVKHFKEDEVDVRIEDGFVVITAKHEEHPDEYGFISRSFTRRYKLPDDVESDKVTSFLRLDGVLAIKAPRKVAVPPAFEGGTVAEFEYSPFVDEMMNHCILENMPVLKVDSDNQILL